MSPKADLPWHSSRHAAPQEKKDISPTEVVLCSAEDRQEIKHLLARTHADDYSVWFETACALKRLGVPYEVFRDWSATSEKFDEDECAQKWDNLPNEPRCGWPTLRKNAAAASFVPVPEEMLPEPQTEDECAAQAAHYIVSHFKPGESFEVCGHKVNPHNEKHLIPDRSIKKLISLDEGETEEVLSQYEVFRAWLQDGILGGVVVSQNPVSVPPDYTGFAPSDAIVSRNDVALVESDDIPIPDQWERFKQMRLPVISVVFSAGKSFHIACRIDAGTNPQLYRERVNKLYDYVRGFGLKPDEKCKNPSRLTRLPGAMRDGKRQYLVCGPCGYPDWESFEICELSRINAATETKSSPIKGAMSHKQVNRAARAGSSPTCSQEEKALLDELEQKYDIPFTLTAKDKVAQINEAFWGHYVARYHRLIKVTEVIWRYDEETGVWSPVDLEEWTDLVVQTAHHYAEIMDAYKDLVSKMTLQVCKNLMTNVPKVKEDPFKTRPKNVIHVANGMVEISKDGTCTLMPYDRKYYSQSRCNIAYNPSAQCPRFINELLKPQLETEDDLNSFLLYGAQCLLPGNDIQKFLVITGTPGGGKDTSVNIIRAIVGNNFCSELRKGHFADRFEMASFIGCCLLLGSDVDSDFLLVRDAGAVKKLCGGNLVEAEIKNVTKRFKLEGHFKIIITSNKYLRVRLDGDMGAWGRRMLIIPFVGETPENPIPHFDEVLLEEEGEGILNLLIQKAADLLQHGFPKEALAHTRAVRFLQHQFDPIGSFLSECVEEADSGPGITKEELEKKYTVWCKFNNLPTLVGDKLPKMLSAGMGATFNVSESHSVGTKRGFHGVAFKADNP